MSVYAEACRCRARTGATLNSSIFGALSLTDYGPFQALHTLHYRGQPA